MNPNLINEIWKDYIEEFRRALEAEGYEVERVDFFPGKMIKFIIKNESPIIITMEAGKPS